mgnify:CR=1 FL=1
MHGIEPFYQWRDWYKAEEDPRSPFYQRTYNQMYYTQSIYDHVIHPQWDEIGSSTLYVKVLYVNYDQKMAFIELFGEWNDCLHNDIMYLKREVIDLLIEDGIQYFTLIGENLLQFHGDTEDYYEEWFEEVEEGWIIALNFRDHITDQLRQFRLDYYLNFGAELDEFPWRKFSPLHLFKSLDQIMRHRLT